MVHPKDKTPKHKPVNIVCAVQYSEGCSDLYTGETKQPPTKHMTQHRSATPTGQDSALHLHLKVKSHSFKDADVHILDRWFESKVVETTYLTIVQQYITECLLQASLVLICSYMHWIHSHILFCT